MEFTPTEKSLIFQCESNVRQGVIHELSLRLSYTQESAMFQTISQLLRKLHAIPEDVCNAAITNIQKSYIPSAGSKTMGERIAEARRQSGAEKLKGQDLKREQILTHSDITLPVPAAERQQISLFDDDRPSVLGQLATVKAQEKSAGVKPTTKKKEDMQL